MQGISNPCIQHTPLDGQRLTKFFRKLLLIETDPIDGHFDGQFGRIDSSDP